MNVGIGAICLIMTEVEAKYAVPKRRIHSDKFLLLSSKRYKSPSSQ
jgi:hypothetical protein